MEGPRTLDIILYYLLNGRVILNQCSQAHECKLIIVRRLKMQLHQNVTLCRHKQTFESFVLRHYEVTNRDENLNKPILERGMIRLSRENRKKLFAEKLTLFQASETRKSKKNRRKIV